jgi:hypothetical protein
VRDFADRIERLRARPTIGRFVFLDQTRHDVNDNLTILGCTLFSNVPADSVAEVGGRLVDFKQIEGWKVPDHVAAHAADLAWLNRQVKEIHEREPNRRIAIFTHHSPTLDEEAVDPRHKSSPVAAGFVTDLRGEECWKNEAVVLWGYGHTHYCCDYFFEKSAGEGEENKKMMMRVVANQKGYPTALEVPFDMKKVLMI